MMGGIGVLHAQTKPAVGFAATGWAAAARLRERPRNPFLRRLERFFAHPLLSVAFIFGILGAVGAHGFERSGLYAQFVAEYGAPGDVLARALGMGVEQATISGLGQLSERRVLELAGVGPRRSLPYLDAGAMREQLLADPLIADAQVRKLFPNRLTISVVERQPFALWQQKGKLRVVAADGVVLNELRDERDARLPHIVGEGANERLQEYMAVLAALGDVAGRVSAGVLVSGRRWTLHSREGVEILLPETAPAEAAAQLARLQRDVRILDKDLAVVDLRDPARLVLRLGDGAVLRHGDPSSKGKA